MAFTRFHDDPCRVAKQLQQSTDVGRWILNVPGNGDKPQYMADPQIRIQGWGANLMTNCINLESELKGVNRPLNKDCLGVDNYTNAKYQVNSQQIHYPTNTSMYTEESRTIMPAWTARDLEQVDWYTLPLNPQENTCMPFSNNLSTRIIEKDYFVQKNTCSLPNNNSPQDYFPLPVSYKNGQSANCSSTNSCQQGF